MKLPPVEVISSDSSHIELRLEMDPNLDVFEGHFDSIAILPGVVQVDWAITIFKQYFPEYSQLLVKRIDTLKFHKAILAGYQVILKLNFDQEKLLFNYSSDNGKHSSGKILVG
jgi:3-hydroxymyristoyl/3-hydroxydecanoyl-(acyl carrier protein) dehydratase